jgi:hypothetical protein
MARVNSRPPSVVPSGVPAGTPAPSRCFGVSEDSEIVRTPARLPGASRLFTAATCISEEVATGTETAAASSFWNSARKPQLVVIPSTPSAASSCAAAMKVSSSPAAPCRTTRSGEAERTIL